MKNSLETRLGMFIAVAMAAAFLILETVGSLNILKPGYHLKAQFNNIQDLKVGNPVKMAGVPIGQVEKISLATNKVEITLRLNRDAMVKTDSKATIKFTGLMGENYVAIDFGGADSPRLLDDKQIMTTEQPDLSTLVAKLDDVASGVQNLTKSFTGDKLDNILGPFTTFMKDNNPRISAILANFEGISGRIARGEGTVGKLINDETLYQTALTTVSNLQDTATEIKSGVADARTMVKQVQTGVIDEINAGHGTMGKLLKDDALYVQTTAAMKNIREITDKINQGQGSVGKLVNDTEFYKNAKLTLQKLDKATEGLEDQGPLSVVGTMVQTLF